MIAWLGETLIATGLLMVVVIAVRMPVARMFGARAAYALWLAPLLRLLMPPLPDALVAGMTIHHEATAGAVVLVSHSAGGLAAGPMLAAVWLVGAVGFLAFHAVAHHRFLAMAIARGRRLPIAAEGPELVESAAVEGPIATGIVRRRIFIPEGFDRRLTREQCDLAIAHERLHHCRGDLLALAASLILLAIHWFNPLAHYAHRLFRRDLEAACDAQLTASLSAEQRHEYARAIVGCAAAPVPRAICTLTTTDDLKRRLKMLKWNHGTFARFAGSGCAATIALGGLLLTAPVQAQASQTTAAPPTQKEVKIIRIAGEGKDGGPAHADSGTRIVKCAGDKVEASAKSEAGNKHTRIVLCGKEGATSAQTAEALEKAVNRIEADSQLPAENKAQVLAQLRAKIAELRSR